MERWDVQGQATSKQDAAIMVPIQVRSFWREPSYLFSGGGGGGGGGVGAKGLVCLFNSGEGGRLYWRSL